MMMEPGSIWWNGTSAGLPGQSAAAFQSQTGSNVLNQGWNASNSAVKVRLDGNVSAFDSSGVQAIVFPLTS
jgi:hypothetical protein